MYPSGAGCRLPYSYTPPQNDNLFLHHHISQSQHQHCAGSSADRPLLPTQLGDYYCSAAAENTQLATDAAADGQAYPIPAPLPQQPRKKVAKRDRHSKINTAQGPRDRRMRLSLEIAREFFDLQDTLGFDKASKTVEWLLVNSRAAIHELSHNFLPIAATSASMTASSSSECHMASETNGADGPWRQVVAKAAPARVANSKRYSKKAVVVREARAQARARARDRTEEKRLLRMRCEMSGGSGGGRREDNFGTALSRSINTSGGQQLGSSPDDMFEDSWSPSTIFGSHFHQEVSSHRNVYVPDQSNWDTPHQHHIGVSGGIVHKTITATQLNLETPVCGGVIPLEDSIPTPNNYSSFVNMATAAATKAAAAVPHQFLGLHFNGRPGWDDAY